MIRGRNNFLIHRLIDWGRSKCHEGGEVKVSRIAIKPASLSPHGDL